MDRNGTDSHIIEFGEGFFYDASDTNAIPEDQGWPWSDLTNHNPIQMTYGPKRFNSELDRHWPWQAGSDNQRKEFAAPMLCPVMEGHWFPKKSWANLAFDVDFQRDYGSGSDHLWIWLWIHPDQDTYSRRMYVYWDNTQVASVIIRPFWDFKGAIKIDVSQHSDKMHEGHHRLEVAVTYGGYVAHGWKMMYVWPGLGPTDNSGTQLPPQNEVTGQPPPYPGEGPEGLSEFCQFSSKAYSAYPWMEFEVYAGPGTIVNIVTENWNDPYYRLIEVKWDDGRTWWILSPGAYQIDIGDEADDSLHELQLNFLHLLSVDYAKRIPIVAVHHVGWNVEVDAMQGLDHSTLTNAIEDTESYYETRGYHRMEYHLDDTDIPFDSLTTDSEFYSLHDNHFYHVGQGGWVWTMLLNELTGDDITVGAFFPGYGIAIAQKGIADAIDWDGGNRLQWMTMSFMHEFGHSINIIEFVFIWEWYCENADCVMAIAGAANTRYHTPWYCFYHWSLRNKY
jgi:hypothetical protein